MRIIIGGDFSLFHMHIVMLIELTIIPACLVLLMSKEGDYSNFIKVVIYVGCVGAIISTLCFLIKSAIIFWASFTLDSEWVG